MCISDTHTPLKCKYVTALNAVEATALKRAKEERRRFSDSHRHPPKRQGDILEGSQRDSAFRVNQNQIYIYITLISLEYRNVNSNCYFRLVK